MEIELKFTREGDGSSTNFQVIKDRADPNFSSRETKSRFILTARLRGYKRRNVSIDINEGGTLISISCERRVKETTMVGQKLYKKEIEVKGFKKVFRIPDGVALDNIEAKFDEDDSILTVTLPKTVKGLRGTKIEEVAEKEEVIDEKTRTADDDVVPERIEPKPDLESNNDAESSGVNEQDDSQNRLHGNVRERREEEKNEEDDEGPRANEPSANNQENIPRDELKDESFKLCTPIIAGSALLLSFVAFVVHIIRNKNQTARRRD